MSLSFTIQFAKRASLALCLFLTSFLLMAFEGDDDILSKKLADDAATIYLYLVKIYNTFGQKEAAEALENKLKNA